jgi:hypothetical protein
MIPVVIHREVDALRTTKSDFSKMISYVSSKAIAVETCHLLSDWRDADLQMWATANGNTRCKTLTYHLVLSWPETEQPTPAQAILAAKHAVKVLGAEKHQCVIAVHTDGDCTHVHVAINRINPSTLKALSFSNDYMKLEEACRQIEVNQGWSADRGRFDVVVDKILDGPVIRLVPKPQSHWDEKLTRRDAERGAAKSDLHHERRTGMAPVIELLTAAWKARIRHAMDTAASWPLLHWSLKKLGLTYAKRPSGARLKITGSDQFIAPSQLGRRFGFKTLVKRLGPWVAAKPAAVEARTQEVTEFLNTVSRKTPEITVQLPRSRLTQMYVAITRVEMASVQVDDLAINTALQRVSLRDGRVVEGDAEMIRTTSSEDYSMQASIIIALAKSQGWVDWDVTGDARFQRAIKIVAADVGLGQGAARDHLNLPQSPPSAQDPHADRSHETLDVAAKPKNLFQSRRLAANSVERSALKAEQSIERERLRVKLGSKRGMIEQVFRASLKLHHANHLKALTERQKRRWQSDIAPFPKIGPLPLMERLRRRADRSLRNPVSGVVIDDWSKPNVLDHTDCRRMWSSALVQKGSQSSSDGHSIMDENVAVLSNDCRILEAGDTSILLLAHRDLAENIVGFEYMLVRDDENFEPAFALGGKSTLFVTNDHHPPARAVVAPWGIYSLAAKSDERRDDTIYISIGGQLTPASQQRLPKLLNDKSVFGLFDTSEKEQALFFMIKKIIPEIENLQQGIRPVILDLDEPLNVNDAEVIPVETEPEFLM